ARARRVIRTPPPPPTHTHNCIVLIRSGGSTQKGILNYSKPRRRLKNPNKVRGEFQRTIDRKDVCKTEPYTHTHTHTNTHSHTHTRIHTLTHIKYTHTYGHAGDATRL